LKVIGLVGKAGAGKDVVSEIMGRRYPSVRMGDVVIDEVRRRGLDVTDKNVGEVANDLRKKGGMDAIAKRCVDRVRSLEAPIAVINGIRGPDEVSFFRGIFENFVLVEVWAPEMVRYERIRSRSRADDTRDFAQFRARDRRENSWGLEEAASMADMRIKNDGSLSSLEERTLEVMKSVEADP